MATRKGGEMVYLIYRAVTYGLSPLINLHLRWRKFRGLEHPFRWPERLGRPSLPRPPGALIWFHAVSLGEGMSVVPVIKRCVEQRPDVTVLMTTTTASALFWLLKGIVCGVQINIYDVSRSEVLKNLLPCGVIYQFAPVDTPAAVNAFLGYWKPYALVLVENELWPNLVLGASANGVMLALLNARMSIKSFKNWSRPAVCLLASLMLSKFSLIVPLSNIQAIHFQLLQAPPFIINFSGDLKLGMEELVNMGKSMGNMEDIREKIAERLVWMASSIHRGEEEVMLGVHRVLMQKHPDLLTIIAPRHPHLGQEIALCLQELKKKGVNVALRSHGDSLTSETSVYVVDTLGELRQFYRLIPIAVIGGSFLPGLSGHNIAEAAAAGCSVLTGQHVGHFSHMAMAMQRLNPLSVTQVNGKMELEEILNKLLSNPEILETRRMAAKQAFDALSSGVIENVWMLLQLRVFKNAKAEG